MEDKSHEWSSLVPLNQVSFHTVSCWMTAAPRLIRLVVQYLLWSHLASSTHAGKTLGPREEILKSSFYTLGWLCFWLSTRAPAADVSVDIHKFVDCQTSGSILSFTALLSGLLMKSPVSCHTMLFEQSAFFPVVSPPFLSVISSVMI